MDFDINRILINGHDLLVMIVNIHNKEVPIMAKIHNADIGLIEYETYRPKDSQYNTVEICTAVSAVDYFDDMKYFCQLFASKEQVSIQYFLETFFQQLKGHIDKYERLVDDDLYSYIDQAIIAKKIIWLTFYNEDVDSSEATILWRKLKNDSYKYFRDSIYITKREFSISKGLDLSLLKLTDLEDN